MLHNEIQVKTWHVILYTLVQITGASYYFGAQQQLIEELDKRSETATVQLKAMEMTIAEIQATRFRREDGDRISALAHANSTSIAVIQTQTVEMKQDVLRMDEKLDKILDRLGP